MSGKGLTTTLIILGLFQISSTQILLCTYRILNPYGYTCDLVLFNPNGTYNFSRVSGTHLTGKGNEDVRFVARTSDSNSINIPSLICDTFPNVVWLALYQIGIVYFDENTFKNCKELTNLDLSRNKILEINENSFKENVKLNYLYLYSNQLTSLPDNVFANLKNLSNLYLELNNLKTPKQEWLEPLKNLKLLTLNSNQIEELPTNVFSSLKQLTYIDLSNNKLKVIHATSFGVLPYLTTVYMYNNQIDAFDQNFIDDTAVKFLDFSNNVCANFSTTDHTISRLVIRIELLKCFENYANLVPERTTTETSSTDLTSPSDCANGNIDKRVCNLEDRTEDFNDKFHYQDSINKNLSASIRELEIKINELVRCPCGCS